jgi:hypothetical protein
MINIAAARSVTTKTDEAIVEAIPIDEHSYCYEQGTKGVAIIGQQHA